MYLDEGMLYMCWNSIIIMIMTWKSINSYEMHDKKIVKWWFDLLKKASLSRIIRAYASNSILSKLQENNKKKKTGNW